MINTTDTSRNVKVTKEGELSAEQAAAMMLGPHVYSMFLHVSWRKIKDPFGKH